MNDAPEITGGAGPFEAAAIVAVISHLLEGEAMAQASRPPSNRTPAWMRAARPRDPNDPFDILLLDHRGDSL